MRRQHGTASAPPPRVPAYTAPHTHPTRTQRRAPPAFSTLARHKVRTTRRHRAARLRAEALKLLAFSFFAKHFKLFVSLPNVSEKDVKGLLFRKQPLHTSSNRSKKGESGDALLSSLGNLSSPPRRLERVESQSDCSKPERFDELTLTWFIDTIDVWLTKVMNAATSDSRSKLEGRACFVLFRYYF